MVVQLLNNNLNYCRKMSKPLTRGVPKSPARKAPKSLTRKVLPIISTIILAVGASGCCCKNRGPNYCKKEEAITEMKSRAERGSINPIIYDKGVMYINENGDIINLKHSCGYKKILEALYRGLNDIFRNKPQSNINGTELKLAVDNHMPEIDPGGDKYSNMLISAARDRLNLMCDEFSAPNSLGGTAITMKEVQVMMKRWAAKNALKQEIIPKYE